MKNMTFTKEEANRMLEEEMHKLAMEELVIEAPGIIQAEIVNPKIEPKAKEEKSTMVDHNEVLGLVAKRLHNPALMGEVVLTGIYKHMAWKKVWVTGPDGKRHSKKEFDGLRDYDDNRVAPMPIHSPLKKFVDDGDLRYCRIAQVDQHQKFYKREKYQAFRAFAETAKGAGYLCIQPDWKDSELQIFYETPEKLAEFFGVTLEKLYKSLGKLHKWLKLVKTPTKLTMESGTMIRVLYINEEPTPFGKPRFDGDIFVKYDLLGFKASGAQVWDGFMEMLQMRSFKSCNILLKGLPIFNDTHFYRKARTLKEKYGSSKHYDMIINQHSVKFDNIGLEDGKIYTFKADELFRFVGGRFKAGSSTLGAQLVAMNDMAIASGILKEHGLMESSLLIKALAKGMPYAWIHIAHDYKKVDTNKFLELAFCINRPEYGWRMAKMASLHNRNMSFLESEWRKRISSVAVNTESAYAYTDERCDGASEMWHEARGEWKSFAVVPATTQEHDLNEKGEVASIKYPLHSAPCICSHTALRENIFDPKSPLVKGLNGGLGLSTMYQRSVMGLDTDGDKLAKFKTAFSIPVEFDFSEAPKEEKGGKDEPITNLIQAVQETLYLAHGAAADTLAIGTIDLSIRYCFMWCHLNGVAITTQISAAVGALREGGIKGGVKGDTKGIANASTQLDIPASLEANTLQQDILAWFGALVGTTITPMSDFGEINKGNLAELAHNLVVKGAGCVQRGHGDKFKYRMQTLLPAYMAHPGSKVNNPWHDAMVLLSDGIKPEYLAYEKMDCSIIQNQYKRCWELVESSFKAYGKEGLDYEFDLDQVKGFATWLNSYYKANSIGIQANFRGIRDNSTGEYLQIGDFDSDRKTRSYIKLLRVIRFLLNGMVPPPRDVAMLPAGVIPENVLGRGMWLAQKNRQTDAYLKFAHIFIGTSEFNVKGSEGNSGGVAWNFPAQIVYDARAMYYDATEEGKKQARNPYLQIACGLAVEFDNMWMKRSLEWVEKNPDAYEYFVPETDYDGFEEEEIANEINHACSDYDSCD